MQTALFTKALVGQAVKDSFVKLDPRVQLKNPVMFITEIARSVDEHFGHFRSRTPTLLGL